MHLHPTRLVALIATLAVGFGGFAVANAEASTWRSCYVEPTTTQWRPDGYAAGVYMRTRSLRVKSPMNCSSGRYALRRAQRYFRRRAYLPTVFYDGYVTWFGFLRSGSIWKGQAQYDELESNTAFRFRFHIYSD